MPSSVDTGTICPFPYTWPREALPPYALEDCTITYADWLGTEHTVLQCVLCIVSFSCLLLMILRLFQLHKYAHAQRQRVRDQPSFFFMLFGMLFTFLLTLENIDVFALRGWYPAELYYILDELVAASLIVCAVVLVDFWVRLARGIGNTRTGLPQWELVLLVCCVFANFLGWIIFGVSDPANFYLYESLKSFCGCVILGGFAVRAGFAVRKLHRTLVANTTSESNNAKATASTKRAVKMLVRKYTQFSFLLLLASAALLANGVLALRLDEGMNWHWRVRVVDQYDPVQIVLRVVYMLGVFAVVSFFRVPKQMVVQEDRDKATTVKSSGAVVASPGSQLTRKLTSKASNLRSYFPSAPAPATVKTEVESNLFAGEDGIANPVYENQKATALASRSSS